MWFLRCANYCSGAAWALAQVVRDGVGVVVGLRFKS